MYVDFSGVIILQVKLVSGTLCKVKFYNFPVVVNNYYAPVPLPMPTWQRAWWIDWLKAER